MRVCSLAKQRGSTCINIGFWFNFISLFHNLGAIFDGYQPSLNCAVLHSFLVSPLSPYFSSKRFREPKKIVSKGLLDTCEIHWKKLLLLRNDYRSTAHHLWKLCVKIEEADFGRSFWEYIFYMSTYSHNLPEQGAFEIFFNCARRFPKNSALKKLSGLDVISRSVLIFSSSAQTPTG